jgi:hypothetical protein
MRETTLSLFAAAALAACSPMELTPPDKADGGGPPVQQCPEGQLECTGDPDNGSLVCRCKAVFECPTSEKCERDAPVPPGGGHWDCSWQEFKYTCTSTDVKEVPGGTGWGCVETEQGVTCTTTPVAPDGSGSWGCKVVGGTLVCEKKPTGTTGWQCTPDGKVCTQGGESLPPGGGSWKCHSSQKGGALVWICVGDSPQPPGGGGWTCVKVDELGGYRCERPVEQPPGGGSYQCVMGSELGGTRCELVPTNTKKSTCQIGEVMWCDGLTYCGWGQVTCDPATGTWKTKIVGGQEVLDCYELANAERPNTVCACYHFYFNPACCERPDCVVPSGTKPQVCPPSAGGLCDYCNPKSPECKGVGAKCIVSNAHETFCGELCSAQKPCPAGYQCMVVKLAGGQSTNQCVPADFSCYF